MTLVKYTSRQLLAKIPDSGTFTAEDIDTTDVLPRREALGGAITTLAREKLIRKCGSNPVRYMAGARRNVWELTDLGRYHKARGR